MRSLMLVQSAVAGDSRVLREAETLVGAGHEVTVIGRDVPEDFAAPPGVTVVAVGRSQGLRPGANSLGSARSLSIVERAGRWLLLPEHRARVERAWRTKAAELASSLSYDVVHAHDFNTLPLGAQLARTRGTPLVYDAHELWSGRLLPGRPAPIRRHRELVSEHRLAGQAAVVLTVSDGIAERLRARGLPNVRVVRNTFPPASAVHRELVQSPVGIVYAGRIGPGRDLETVLGAVAADSTLRPVLVGPVDAAFAAGLRPQPGVTILPPIPVDEIDDLYRSNGIALVTLTDTCENHRLALPNKLFHAVRAGVPVVAADLPELRRVVTQYRLGTLYRPGDTASLLRALRGMVDRFDEFVEAVRVARQQLSWDQDARQLLGAYRALTIGA